MKHRHGPHHTAEAASQKPEAVQGNLHRHDNAVPQGLEHPSFALFSPDSVRDDDNREFLEMFTNSQRTIFQICLHFTDRQPDSIRDLYQEISAALWESWPKFRGGSKTNTWVRRIALNTAVTEIRQHDRQPQFVPFEDWMYDSIADEASAAPPDYYRLISALDPDDRAFLYLRLDGLSNSEIAETLFTTEAAVKQKFYRLRQKIDTLKCQLNDEQDE